MRIAVTIPDGTVGDLMRFSEAKTKIEAVNRIVAEWVRRKKRAMFEKIEESINRRRGRQSP